MGGIDDVLCITEIFMNVASFELVICRACAYIYVLLNIVAMCCEIDVGLLSRVGLWSSSGSEADLSYKVASCSN
jgi:hypothetical protein